MASSKKSTKGGGGGASIDEVGVWSSEIDAKIEGVDVVIEYLRNFLSETKEQSQLVELVRKRKRKTGNEAGI